MKITWDQYAAVCGAIDAAKTDDKPKDTDEYAGAILEALGMELADLTDDEIIAYSLAHAAATLNMSSDDDAHCMELLYQYGHKIGVDVPLGDEYQRAVLHRFDPERVPDFPLDTEET